MSSDLKTLDSVCIQITDGTHSTVRDDLSGNCFLLSAKNIKGKVLISKKERKISRETLISLRKRTKTDKGDVLLTSVGTIGETAIILEDSPNYEFQRSVAILKPDKTKIIPEFLLYNLKGRRHELESTATGAVQRCLFIGQIKALEIDLPTIQTQKEIAKILVDFDRKIELNRRINETLEQIGQALFNEYFVKNLEKDDWAESQIAYFANYKRVTRKPQEEEQVEFTHYSIPAFDDNFKADSVLGSEIKSNKYRVMNDTILVSKLNPSTPRIWPIFCVDENAICSTEFVVLQPKKYYSFLYFLLNSRIYQETMIAAAGGTSNSHKRVSPEFINSFSFPTPPEDLLQEFESATKGLLLKRDLNIKMNNSLVDIRDTLLPKLIGGKIKL